MENTILRATCALGRDSIVVVLLHRLGFFTDKMWFDNDAQWVNTAGKCGKQ